MRLGESLIVRLPKNSAVKVPEDDLIKKTSNGSSEPNEPLWCVCGDQVSSVIAAKVQTVDRGTSGSPSQKSDEEEWFMKVKILGIVILTAMILAVAFSASAPAAPNTANANAVPAPAPAPAPAKAVPADHPEIHDAINSLRHAREHLDHAAHDFGGHRVEAIRAIDEALHQLDFCLKYDR